MRAICLWLFALLCEAGMLDLFAWLCEAGYGDPRTIAEASELPSTFGGLVLGGPIALAATALAITTWLHRCRLWVGIVCVVGLGVPLVLASTLATHVLLCVGNVF